MADSKAESQQADKFRDLARELECDEDEAAFEEKVRRVATATVGDPDNPDWTAEDFRRAKRVKGGGVADHAGKVRKVTSAPGSEGDKED